MSLDLHVDPFGLWIASPANFDHKVLWDCGAFLNGRAFKPSEMNMERRGLPIIKITELKYGISDTTAFFDGEFDEKHIINDGDILFAWSGNPTTSIDIFRWKGNKAILNQHIFKVIPKDDFFEFEYFSYILKYMKPTFVELARDQATSMGHVKVSDLKTLICKFPDKRRQLEATKHLKLVEDKINVNFQMNLQLECFANSVFKEWFIDFGPVKTKSQGRLPFGMDENTASLFPDTLEKSELGLAPKGWRAGRLDEIAEIVGGGTPSTSQQTYYCESGTGIPWLSPKDLSGYPWKYIKNGAADITELGLKNSSARMLPASAVLFSSRAPIGYIAIAETEVCTNQGFKSLVPKNGSNSEYLYHLLKSNIDFIESRASGSTFKEISGNGMRELPVLIPPKQIMDSFEKFISANSELQKQLRHETNYLIETRDLLLSKLVSGEIELRALNV